MKEQSLFLSDQNQVNPYKHATTTMAIIRPSDIPDAPVISEQPKDKTQAKNTGPNPVPPTTSILLQGTPSKTEKTLFLFPDGAGSAFSYASIPRIDPSLSLVALNSPYHRQPHLFRCSLDDLIKSYIAEIRRRQPTGPYHFGGWSAGGILAYRATQVMIEELHEPVTSLVLIDSPVPRGLARLPQYFYDYCNKMNVFGLPQGNKPAQAPEWLIPHFNATIDTLHEYHAAPLMLDNANAPHVSIIWACESVMDGADILRPSSYSEDEDENEEGVKFLTERRTDFSGCGWETLFPGGEVRIEKAPEANHFTMMRGEFAPKLACFIRGSVFQS